MPLSPLQCNVDFAAAMGVSLVELAPMLRDFTATDLVRVALRLGCEISDLFVPTRS